MQRRLRIATAAGALFILGAVLFMHSRLISLPDRQELGPRIAELRFEPADLDSSRLRPLRLAGAWTITSNDPRVGAISALAVEGGELVALTDSGVVIRFGKPPRRLAPARVDELPGGPGDGRLKRNRDSEAIARDPLGRGWWVAFENRDELWLYDPQFERALMRLAIPSRRLATNRGVEGLAPVGNGLLLVPEDGGSVLLLTSRGWSEVPSDQPAVRSSDAAALPGGALLVIERRLTPFGVRNALALLKPCRSGFCRVWRKPLALGALDNLEGVAAEPLPSGGTRLWLVTDDDWHRPLRTLLIAADLPPQD